MFSFSVTDRKISLNTNFFLSDIQIYDNYITGIIVLKFNDENLYRTLEFTKFPIKYSNKICEILGYDNLFSLVKFKWIKDNTNLSAEIKNEYDENM